MSTQPNLAAARAAILKLDFPQSLGVFDTYAGAQKMVDHLSDNEFPVQDVMIVGTDLKQIERVTGRLTLGRVAMGGLLSGLWIGSFVGLVMLILEGGSAWSVFLTTLLFGAVFGLIWALVGYQMSSRDRDFTSITSVIATKYEVLTEHKHVQRAHELLGATDALAVAQEQVRRAQAEAQAKWDAEHGGNAGA